MYENHAPSVRPKEAGGVSRRTVVGMLLGSATFTAVGGLHGPSAVAAPPPRPAEPQELADALRWLDKPGLAVTELAVISGRDHRVRFHSAEWDGGQAIVRDLELRVDGQWHPVTDPARRFDEQWVVLSAAPGAPLADDWARLQHHWVAFTGFRQLNDQVVELVAELPEVARLVVRWDLSGRHPELHQRLTALREGSYIVGHSGFDLTDLSGVNEVLCGARQHAKYVQPGSEPLGAWELFAPMALTQRTLPGIGEATLGCYVPADVLEFVHERNLGASDQPFAMALRNDFNDVAPSSYFPHLGDRTPMQAGESKGFIVGLCVTAADLQTTYASLAREEYRYQAYRHNVFDNSLTDTAHNLAELMMVEPDGDDSVDFVPSYAGWWSRAKGFIDVENDQAVRIAGTAISLMAHRVLGTDLEMYQTRGRPMLEYQVSRRGVGSTPIENNPVYGNRNVWRLGGVAIGGVALNALYQLTGRTTGAFPRLAAERLELDQAKYASVPSMYSLAMWNLTGDRTYLVEARLRGRRYLADNILTPYRTQASDVGFGFSYSKRWTDLVRLYEITGDEDLLDGIHREALRFITESQLRPVPQGTITVPAGIDLRMQHDWADGCLPSYPLTDPPEETVPRWQVSPTGMTFEQLSTYKHSGGFTNNACWSSFLLRLAHHTDDQLLADVAHNQVIGRFTNFPGYYNVQFQVQQQKPDFPYTGPIDISGFWYHHIPGQLALAITHLLGEAYYRSGGQVDFPRDFEANHAYFDWDLYGHQPGTFYGEEGVWPYFPKGLVTLDNSQLNWIAGVGNGDTYLALSNEHARPQRVTVTLGSLLGNDLGTPEVEVLSDPPLGRLTTRSGSFTVTVPGKGFVAVAVRGITATPPWHSKPELSYRGTEAYYSEDLDPDGEEGLLRAMLLVRPDRSGYDAYVQVDTTQQVSFSYRTGESAEQVIDDKPYPNEWTVGVDDLAAPFHFSVSTAQWSSAEVTLQVPASIATDRAGFAAEVHGQSSWTAAADGEVSLWLRNGTEEQLTGFTAEIGVPEGWQLDLDEVPDALAVGEERLITGRLHAPQDVTRSAPGDHVLTGSCSWDGGSADAAALPITVRDPLAIVGVSADPQELARPGDATTLQVAMINPSAVAVTTEVKAWGQPGWTVSGDREVTVPPESEIVHELAVQSPADVAPGTRAQFRAKLDNESTLTTQIMVANSLELIRVSAPSELSWGADDPVEATMILANRTDAALSGTARITAPEGWSTDAASIDWTADAGGRAKIGFTITPDTAAPGTSGTVRISPGGGLSETSLTVHLADPTDQIVLPEHPNYYERGTWLRSSLQGYDGSSSRYSPDFVYGGQIEWRGQIRDAGTYEVSVWYPTNPTTTTDALFTVDAGDEVAEHHVDQQHDADSWRILGNYDCAAGDVVSVVLTAVSGQHTRANAARFRRV